MSKLTIFTDGGARGNPGPAASGVVITDDAEKLRLICGKYLGKTTNNVAEYEAVLLAYETISGKFPETDNLELSFFTDSLLMAKQLAGQYGVKNANLAGYVSKIKIKEKLFAKVTYTHIPREQNKLADSEVNRILDEAKP